MLARQDQKGIVTNITSFIYPDNSSIINLEQHIDTENRLFFMRLSKWLYLCLEYEHCLYGLLLRNLADYQQLIDKLEKCTIHFGIDFMKVPVTKSTKAEIEARQL